LIRKESFSFSVPARLDQLSVLCNRIVTGIREVAPLKVNDRTLYDIELSVNELAANIITHAYNETQMTIKIWVTVTHEDVVIETHDQGRSFLLDDVQMPDLDKGQLHGYGIFLMRELLDDIQYSHQNGVNIWFLTKKW
jgi:serine/threonine-protein kinase RsbW